MDETPLLTYEGMKHKAAPSIYYLNILGIPYIIGILYALLVTEGDCSNLRMWLLVEAGVQIVFTAASISQLSKRFISKSGILIKLPLLLLAIFQLLWLVLGTVWAFSGDSCFEYFAEGFVMVLAIAFIAYTAVVVYGIMYLITFIIETRKKSLNS